METQTDNKDLHTIEPMQSRPFVIRRCSKDTYDTFSLELEPKHGPKQFVFEPGQFNMLNVFGVGEVPISISGDPTDNKRLIHTTRAVGTVTSAMKNLKKGDLIGVRGPYGTAWPVKEAKEHDVIIIAGGIGLAPLRPVIHYVLRNRSQYGRVVLLYGARTPDEILYVKDLEQWRSRFDLETILTVDRATGSWHGNVGVVTTLIPRSPFDPMHALAMVCGPEIMMRFTVLELEKRGVEDDKIFVSMERNMKCGVGLCGHCQMGSSFVCKDGPVYRYSDIRGIFTKREM